MCLKARSSSWARHCTATWVFRFQQQYLRFLNGYWYSNCIMFVCFTTSLCFTQYITLLKHVSSYYKLLLPNLSRACFVQKEKCPMRNASTKRFRTSCLVSKPRVSLSRHVDPMRPAMLVTMPLHRPCNFRMCLTSVFNNLFYCFIFLWLAKI